MEGRYAAWEQPLSERELSQALPGLRVICLERIDSTNTQAKRLLAEGMERPFLLTAESQTGGRGRQGKSFYSPAGTGLYMSVAVFPNASPESAVHATSAAAVAVCRAIRRVLDVPAQIKWVNDIYLHGKKCGGILTEAQADPATGAVRSLVIGVGLNLRTDSFPGELADTAGSLWPERGDRNALAAAVAAELVRLTGDLSGRAWREDYRRWSLALGREIVYWRDGAPFHGRALEIAENGGLLVEHPDGTRALLQSGEITLRLDG